MMSSQAFAAAACPPQAQFCSSKLLPVGAIKRGGSCCLLSPPALSRGGAANGSIHGMCVQKMMQGRLGASFGPEQQRHSKAHRPCKTLAGLETESETTKSIGEEFNLGKSSIQVGIAARAANSEPPRDRIKLVILQDINPDKDVSLPDSPGGGFTFTVNGADLTSVILGRRMAKPSDLGCSLQIFGINTAETPVSPGDYALEFKESGCATYIDIPIFQAATNEDGGVSVPDYPGFDSLQVSTLPGVAIVSPGTTPIDLHLLPGKVTFSFLPQVESDFLRRSDNLPLDEPPPVGIPFPPPYGRA